LSAKTPSSRHTTEKFRHSQLWDCGAKEVHVRPLSAAGFPMPFLLSTRTTQELVARRAIRAIEGRDIEDISEYMVPHSEKYAKMVEWIARDLE
jgi:amidophosphoribosyltransferase